MFITRLKKRLRKQVRSATGRPVADDRLRGVFACEAVPLVYYNLPKCACTTIKNLLFRLETGDWCEDPLAIHKLVSRGPGVLLNRFREERLLKAMRNRSLAFTFVRHPLKRAYSCFNEKIYFESEYSFAGLRNGVLQREYGLHFPTRGADYTLADHRANFLKFLLFVEKNVAGETRVRRDAHWLPQTELLQRLRSRGELDFIGRLERFAPDMRYVLETAGVEDANVLVAKRFNEGPPPPFSYREVLDSEILELGQRLYARDFERLAYSPEAAP